MTSEPWESLDVFISEDLLTLVLLVLTLTGDPPPAACLILSLKDFYLYSIIRKFHSHPIEEASGG